MFIFACGLRKMFSLFYFSHECLKSLLSAGFSPDSLYECTGLTLCRQIPNLPDKETALSYAVAKQNEVAMVILLEAGASSNPPLDKAYHPLLRGKVTFYFCS